MCARQHNVVLRRPIPDATCALCRVGPASASAMEAADTQQPATAEPAASTPGPGLCFTAAPTMLAPTTPAHLLAADSSEAAKQVRAPAASGSPPPRATQPAAHAAALATDGRAPAAPDAACEAQLADLDQADARPAKVHAPVPSATGPEPQQALAPGSSATPVGTLSAADAAASRPVVSKPARCSDTSGTSATISAPCLVSPKADHRHGMPRHNDAWQMQARDAHHAARKSNTPLLGSGAQFTSPPASSQKVDRAAVPAGPVMAGPRKQTAPAKPVPTTPAVAVMAAGPDAPSPPSTRPEINVAEQHVCESALARDILKASGYADTIEAAPVPPGPFHDMMLTERNIVLCALRKFIAEGMRVRACLWGAVSLSSMGHGACRDVHRLITDRLCSSAHASRQPVETSLHAVAHAGTSKQFERSTTLVRGQQSAGTDSEQHGCRLCKQSACKQCQPA